MGVKVVVNPLLEPVSVTEIKEHLNISTNLDDSLLSAYITVAREYCENYQNRALITQTIEYTLDRYPKSVEDIPRPPLQSVSSIKYYDENQTENTFASEKYMVDNSSFVGRIALLKNFTYPTTTLRTVNGVVIRYVAGYGNNASDVPATVKQAIKLIVGHLYEHRENTVERALEEIPMGVKSLLDLNRLWVI